MSKPKRKNSSKEPNNKIIINIDTKSKTRKRRKTKSKGKKLTNHQNATYNPNGISYYSGGSIPLSSANIPESTSQSVIPSRTNKAEYNMKSIVNPPLQITNGDDDSKPKTSNQVVIAPTANPEPTPAKKKGTPIKKVKTPAANNTRKSREAPIITGITYIDELKVPGLRAFFRARGVKDIKNNDSKNTMIRKAMKHFDNQLEGLRQEENKPKNSDPVVTEVDDATNNDNGDNNVNDYQDGNAKSSTHTDNFEDANKSYYSSYSPFSPPYKPRPDDPEDLNYEYNDDINTVASDELMISPKPKQKPKGVDSALTKLKNFVKNANHTLYSDTGFYLSPNIDEEHKTPLMSRLSGRPKIFPGNNHVESFSGNDANNLNAAFEEADNET